MKKITLNPLAFTLLTIFTLMGAACTVDKDEHKDEHFHEKGKWPSKFTIEAQKHQRDTLPFNDKRDFEEAERGFIAAPDYKEIKAEAGHIAWDMGSYEWLLQGKDFG